MEILRRITIFIISYGRFKLDKKWAESDMNFLAIIGDYIGRIFLKERKHD